MSSVPIFFQGEARLIRWGDTATAGLTITLEIEEKGERHPFKGLRYGASNGQRMQVVIVLVDDDETPIAVPNSVEGPRQAANDLPVKQGKRFSELPRSQQAALKLQDPEFCEWLRKQNQWSPDLGADNQLKIALGIESKRELDTDVAKGKLWDSLLTEFDVRVYQR